jgi:hypothetical protein
MIGRPGALDKKCSSRKRRSTEKQRLIDNDYNDNKMEWAPSRRVDAASKGQLGD